MGFWAGKVFWFLFDPLNLLCVALLVALWALASRHKETQRTGYRICAGATVLLLLGLFLPIGTWLLLPLENRFPTQIPDQVTGIIALAGDEEPKLSAERGQPIVSSVQRYIGFAEASRAYPSAKLLFSGGYPWESPADGIGNGTVARQVLNSLQVPLARVTIEESSRNTYENAREAARILAPTPDQNWILITSAFHMPRAMATFRQAGFQVFAKPVDYHTSGQWHLWSHEPFNLTRCLFETRMALREYVGLMAYRLQGKTDSLWPR